MELQPSPSELSDPHWLPKPPSEFGDEWLEDLPLPTLALGEGRRSKGKSRAERLGEEFALDDILYSPKADETTVSQQPQDRSIRDASIGVQDTSGVRVHALGYVQSGGQAQMKGARSRESSHAGEELLDQTLKRKGDFNASLPSPKRQQINTRDANGNMTQPMSKGTASKISNTDACSTPPFQQFKDMEGIDADLIAQFKDIVEFVE